MLVQSRTAQQCSLLRVPYMLLLCWGRGGERRRGEGRGGEGRGGEGEEKAGEGRGEEGEGRGEGRGGEKRGGVGGGEGRGGEGRGVLTKLTKIIFYFIWPLKRVYERCI